jgi:ethanolamine ammonia-lyase small subunit
MKSEISIRPQHLEEDDCWTWLRQFTDARIALGRTGSSVLTNDNLKFRLAHARARDSIKMPFEASLIAEKLEKLGLHSLEVDSKATTREIFITRPDLGRRLSDESRARLKAMHYPGCDVLLVIADGLSSKAVHRQAVPLIEHLLPYLHDLQLTLGPVVLAHQSRVALADDIAELMNVKLVASLIGERPGLSSPDSLSVYMTYKPYVGRMDSERNCISNIRPEGLNYDAAAFKLAWLISTAFDRRVGGTALKDESDDPSKYGKLGALREKYYHDIPQMHKEALKITVG